MTWRKIGLPDTDSTQKGIALNTLDEKEACHKDTDLKTPIVYQLYTSLLSRTVKHLWKLIWVALFLA